MNISMLILFLFTLQTSFAEQDAHSLETIKVQKQIKTQLYLDQRRKAEVLKKHAQLLHKSEQRRSRNKYFATKREERPKSHAPEEVLEKIRKTR